MRPFPVWLCTECMHKVPRDRLDQTPPAQCRGRCNCPGEYVAAHYGDPELPEWEPGQHEAADRHIEESLLRSRVSK